MLNLNVIGAWSPERRLEELGQTKTLVLTLWIRLGMYLSLMGLAVVAMFQELYTDPNSDVMVLLMAGLSGFLLTRSIRALESALVGRLEVKHLVHQIDHCAQAEEQEGSEGE